MKKRNPLFRIILVTALVLVAIYYLFPTFRYERLKKVEADHFAALASISSLDLETISRDAYVGEVDLRSSISNWDSLEETQQQEITDQLDYLKGTFKDQIQGMKYKAIRRGLDLQGGMRMVLEVDLIKLLDNLGQRKDETFDNLLTEIDSLTQDPKVDFFNIVPKVFEAADVPLGRYFLNPRASDSEIIDYIVEEAADAVDRSLEILRNRIDQFGVSEPDIFKQGGRRIVIALPGVQDPARARELIGKTALLEFKLLAEPEAYSSLIDRIDRELLRQQGIEPEADSLADITETTQLDTTGAEVPVDTTQHVAQDTVVDLKDLFGSESDLGEATSGASADASLLEEAPFKALLRDIGQDLVAVPISNYAAVNSIIHRKEIQDLIPRNVEFLWHNEAITGPGGEYFRPLYLVKSEPELTGSAISDAQVDIGSGYNPGSAGKPYVALSLNRQGTRVFSEVTGANVGKQLSIVLDEKVHSAPVIRSKIPSGNAEISGSFTMDEAKDLAIVLRAGALPAPVQVIEERTVGPSLGLDSIRKGQMSIVLGMLFVILFMVIYYRGSGLLADLALLLNLLFVLAVLGGFHATLTLPGIAGIILTIGMAVDANVLIFERIREEIRTGKTIRAAIDTGYSRAFTTIMDANITTLIAGVVLYQFGTGPIRGFALTLMIGIVSSMFTAIVVTRSIYDTITNKYDVKKLSI